jgi:hypothetical protein
LQREAVLVALQRRPSSFTARWLPALLCLAACRVATAQTPVATAQTPVPGAQSLDMELLRERLSELEARQRQIEGGNAEVLRLQSEVAALTARLRQIDVRPVPAALSAACPSAVSQELQPLPPLAPPPLAPYSSGQPVATTYLASVARRVDGPAATDIPDAAPTDSSADLSGAVKTEEAHSGYGYADGLQFGFWGWMSYEATPQEREASFYAWEAELNVTKSFSDRIAASADLDFYDSNKGAQVALDQLFISFLFPEWNDAIFTAGKFDAPYGIERRQFWQRETGSTSLLFNAQPQDLTGLMLTNRWDTANLTFRTFVVNGGFDADPAINQQPSIGMMVEYRPMKSLAFAWTNWWGPELPDDNHDKLFFTEAQVVWQLESKLTVSAEFLYGVSQVPGDFANYTGFLVILDQRLWCDKWRVFAQYSDLNDPYGFFGEAEHGREGNAGVAWRFDPHVEALAEYRHDIGRNFYAAGPVSDQSDTVSLNLSFGY